jgi:hypothetical protein
VPDKVLFKHLRDKLIREDEEDKANKAAARKAKKNVATSQEDDVAEDQPMEDENTNIAENEISKDVAEDPAGSAENETPANNVPYEQSNGHATAPVPDEGAMQDTSSAPSSLLASPEPSRSTEVSPTSRQRKRTKPQSTEKQTKRRKTEHTPPKNVSATQEVLSSPQSTADTTEPLPSPTLTSAQNRPLTEREQRLLKRKHSSGMKDDETNTAAENIALPPPSRKKRNSGGDKAKPVEQVNEISKSSKSVEEEPIIADTTSSQAPEPISSTDTNGPRSASQSEPVTPREFNPDVRTARAKELIEPQRDYAATIPAAADPPVTHIIEDDDGPALMSRYATPHSQLTRPASSNAHSQYTSGQSSFMVNRSQRPPRAVSPQPESSSNIPTLLSDTPAHTKHQWVPESIASNVPMQFNYSSSPFPSSRESSAPQQLPTPMSITPHIPAALMRTTNPTPANRGVPMIPQRTSSSHNIPPLGSSLASFPMAAYGNYQSANYAPTMTQMMQNTQQGYNFNNGSMPNNSYAPSAPPKQPPQYSMITSPRDFEAAFTPFLMNSPDFSAMNANQSAQQYGGPYSMLSYPSQPRQYDKRNDTVSYDIGPPKPPTTFVPYVNNNAK